MYVWEHSLQATSYFAAFNKDVASSVAGRVIVLELHCRYKIASLSEREAVSSPCLGLHFTSHIVHGDQQSMLFFGLTCIQ